MTHSKATNSTVAPTFEPNNLKRLKEITGYDMTRCFTQQFVNSVPKHLADLRQLLACGDADKLRRKAHQFKGESLQLGAIQLGMLCEQVEIQAKQEQLEAVVANLTEMENELAHLVAALKSGGEL